MYYIHTYYYIVRCTVEMTAGSQYLFYNYLFLTCLVLDCCAKKLALKFVYDTIV